MMDIIKLALDNAELKKRIEVLQDLLSSSYNIANRNGEQTHWQRFAGQLHVNGISPVTPKTFKILPSDTEYAQSAQPTPSQSVVDERAEFEKEFKSSDLIYYDEIDNVYKATSYHHSVLASHRQMYWEGWQRRAQLNTKPKNDALDAERYRFIRNNPRFDVCGTDEINEFDAAIDAAINKQIKIEKDAERFQWLTADHDDKEVRKKCRDILERMGAMSYSAACMAIDAAMKEVK